MPCARSKALSATTWRWPRRSRSSSGSYRNSDRQLDLDVMPGQVQACAGHKRLLRDPSAREAGAFGTGAWGKGRAKPLHSCDFCAGTSPLPSGLAFRVTPAGRRAWCGGIFNGAEADFSMKVTVERAELLKSLGHVHRVVERRNTIPILANG